MQIGVLLQYVMSILSQRSPMSAQPTVKKSPDLLPKAAKECARKIEADPKLAANFLKKAGIISRPGKLSTHYR